MRLLIVMVCVGTGSASVEAELGTSPRPALEASADSLSKPDVPETITDSLRTMVLRRFSSLRDSSKARESLEIAIRLAASDFSIGDIASMLDLSASFKNDTSTPEDGGRQINVCVDATSLDDELSGLSGHHLRHALTAISNVTISDRACDWRVVSHSEYTDLETWTGLEVAASIFVMPPPHAREQPDWFGVYYISAAELDSTVFDLGRRLVAELGAIGSRVSVEVPPNTKRIGVVLRAGLVQGGARLVEESPGLVDVVIKIGLAGHIKDSPGVLLSVLADQAPQVALGPFVYSEGTRHNIDDYAARFAFDFERLLRGK